jgi:hypothetical protein
MRTAVIGFKALSGAHSGENLGRYAVGLLDRVGIMSQTGSKACHYYSHMTLLIVNSDGKSFTRQHWIIPETTTQRARLLKKSTTSGVASTGIAMNSSYRTFLFLVSLFSDTFITSKNAPAVA